MKLPLRYDDGASEILDADGEAVCDMFNSSFDSPANARAAAETVFPELDDDALDAIEDEIRSELRSVAGTLVP